MTSPRILIYAGAHCGSSLSKHLNDYDKIFAFEANPVFCEILNRNFGQFKNLKVINAALCNTHGDKVEFHISSNNGESSSLLMANKECNLYNLIKPSGNIFVNGINLGIFLKENGIDSIDTYISDLQGYDFEVLKTLKPLIDRKAINTIECEVGKNNKPLVYISDEIDANTEENFDNLLGTNYKKVATGWGVLNDGIFEKVPDDWYEMDIRWRVKTD